MSDAIGRISVPAVINSGQTFPLTTEYPFGFSVERPVIVHRFGSLDAKQEQRYYAGIGPRKFQFRRPNLNWSEGRALRAFWEDMQGAWKAFTYNVPNPDGTATATLVTFDQAPLSLEYLRNAVQAGLTFVEVVDPTQAPSYAVASTCVRFPSSALSTALLSEVQQIVPLIHVAPRQPAWSATATYAVNDWVSYKGFTYISKVAANTGHQPDTSPTQWRVGDIYLSDRRVTVGGQLYLPRLIGIGESGSDVIISQDIKGSSDNVRFTFGNADRVMTQLANDTDLKYAEIDLCLFHVNSGILLQLWKGVIQNFVSDGTASFPVTCSDGFFQIMNQYPERVVSRQCWKIFNDGVNCPYAAHGLGGDPDSCDYYLESANGCQAHGMAKYFGGQQADPQGVNILDNSTGFVGLGRNRVTATSIISDTVWGLALPEIWCNSGGNPLFAFFAAALMVAYRDESDFSDSLGILGAGPLGGFTASMVVQNADGYRYVVAPMVDGFLWQGLKLDGNLNVSKYQPGYGLRYVPGNDPANPATDSFSLGQGTPQVWQPNIFAAGTAACEIRIQKDSKIQPSTPDQHQMKVPIDFGLWGWTWDKDGNRSAVRGLVNPFWIAVNMLLRAMGLYGDPSTGSNPAGGSGPASEDQLAAFVLPSVAAGDGSGAAEIAADQVAPVLGATSGTAYSITPEGQALNGAQINRNPDGSWTFQYYDGEQPYYDGQQNLVVLPITDAMAAGYAEEDTYAITETQFQFQGVIGSQKPFRDWLAEVLNCCLGFYTWEFGKLKLGCRVNASAVDAYTAANMLFQSLRLTPIQAGFEKLVLSFADVAYAYQANTAEYCDKSHAAYYGRAQSPLTAQMHSVGCSTLSQALRIAATRVREEIGGINPAEWRSARVSSRWYWLVGTALAPAAAASVILRSSMPALSYVFSCFGTYMAGDMQGVWEVYGAKSDNLRLKLAADVDAASAVLPTVEGIPSSWRVNDILVLAAKDQVTADASEYQIQEIGANQATLTAPVGTKCLKRGGVLNLSLARRALGFHVITANQTGLFLSSGYGSTYAQAHHAHSEGIYLENCKFAPPQSYQQSGGAESILCYVNLYGAPDASFGCNLPVGGGVYRDIHILNKQADYNENVVYAKNSSYSKITLRGEGGSTSQILGTNLVLSDWICAQGYPTTSQSYFEFGSSCVNLKATDMFVIGNAYFANGPVTLTRFKQQRTSMGASWSVGTQFASINNFAAFDSEFGDGDANQSFDIYTWTDASVQANFYNCKMGNKGIGNSFTLVPGSYLEWQNFNAAVLCGEWSILPAPADHSLVNVLRGLGTRHKVAWDSNLGRFNVYAEDGETVAHHITPSLDAAAKPIVGVTPA